jgi:hypothetical protein
MIDYYVGEDSKIDTGRRRKSGDSRSRPASTITNETNVTTGGSCSDKSYACFASDEKTKGILFDIEYAISILNCLNNAFKEYEVGREELLASDEEWVRKMNQVETAVGKLKGVKEKLTE